MGQSKFVRRADIKENDEIVAAGQFIDKVYQPDMAGVVFFCSSEYNLDKLAQVFNERLSCPVIGCTTAGEIGSHYQTGSIVGASFSSDVFKFHVEVIQPLAEFSMEESHNLAEKLQASLVYSESLNDKNMVGFLLVDGLSVLEEKITAYLYRGMQGTPIIGGSAGDNLKFIETKVYANGQFMSDAAIFTLIETKLPFTTFKLQHFVPSDLDLVVTNADPDKRIVHEIDGGLAGEEYAHMLNLEPDDLCDEVFATNPLMLQIGEDWFVRSIQVMNSNGSLRFASAIDNGLPLTIGRSIGLVKSLEKKIEELENEFVDIEFTLGCDCILRRFEIVEKNLMNDVENLLKRINFVGFSSFGEQYNALHVNQTLTGVVFGR
ncbi:FIST C-terminal domain-containing protein [candidate division KSB1 bacterium]|nr:FIST C-terminal domain-containing protein [candidate division KSB1 bacterium]